MLKQIRAAMVSLLVFTVILGLAYPLFINIAGNLFFPHHARGGLIEGSDHRVIGAKFIGQNFSAPYYFHPRPSNAGESGYDGMASGSSNLGPTSQELIDTLKKRIDLYKKENNLSEDSILPSDAVTSSGSGLDPHISVENAYLQSNRVASERNIELSAVRALIRKVTSKRFLGLFGEPHVNVLQLNLKLEEQFPRSRPLEG